MATYIIDRTYNAASPLTSGDPTAIWSYAGAWSTARAGSGLEVKSSPNASFLHAYTPVAYTPTYYAKQFLWEWETAIIGSENRVTSATVRVNAHADDTLTYTFNIRSKSFSYPLATSDWVAGENLTTLPLLGSGSFSGGFNYVETDVDRAGINVSGTTQFLLHDSLQESTATPTVNNTQTLRAGATSGHNLTVYTVPAQSESTLMGVHDAAVQLSDGSTVYLETDVATTPTVYLKKVTLAGVVSTLATNPTSSTWDPEAVGWGLQNITLAVDNEDVIYVFNGYTAYFSAYTSTGTWLGDGNADGGTHLQAYNNNLCAMVWCDAGNATNAKGRLLVVVAHLDTGEYKWAIYDASSVQTSNGGNILRSDYGSSPAWLVSSSLYRNTFGTGLSLATDVFGGTRVGAFAWSLSGTTYQSRTAMFTVGASISSVTTETSTTFDLSGMRGKILGYGADQFVVVSNMASNSGVGIRNLGNTITSGVVSDTIFFDAVYDYRSEGVWVYYWDPLNNDKLMKRPYYPSTRLLGTAELVLTDATAATRDFIRTVKHLRNPWYVEIHYNRTGT